MNLRSAALSLCAVAVFLSGCGGGSDEPERAKFACPAKLVSPVVSPQGVLGGAAPPATGLFDLMALPATSVPFARYDLKSSMSYSYGFAVQDFDCDSRVDVSFFDSYTGGRSAFRTETGAIGYVQWNGGPLEEVVPSDTFPELVQPPSAVALLERQVSVDINGDTFPDVVGVVNSHGAVAAYLNPGYRDGIWKRQYLSTAAPGAVNIAAGDLDGDGDTDVVVALRVNSSDAGQVPRSLIWLENPGSASGTWTQHSIEGSGDMADPRTLQAADIDGNGIPDVAVSDNASGRLYWFKRDALGTWERHAIAPGISLDPAVPTLITSHGHYGIAVDVDLDGRIDILQPVYQGITWLRNVDDGTTWQVIPIARFAREATQLIVSEVALGDIDLDGKSDVVFVVSSTGGEPTAPRRGGVYWLRQGVANWDAFRITQDDSSAVGVKLLDYDGDGDLDIISNTEYQSNAVTLWFNEVR